MPAQRFNVYGCLFDIKRSADRWLVLAVCNDGKRAPAGFVIPEFVADAELEQYLFISSTRKRREGGRHFWGSATSRTMHLRGCAWLDRECS